MTQEEKIELLLKDLCGRLPYDVKSQYTINNTLYISNIYNISSTGRININGHIKDICDIKPYLFPLSSITEELKEEHKDLLENQYHFDGNGNVFTLQDFYCKYHIDYRGLIPMGLAIDATNLEIY